MNILFVEDDLSTRVHMAEFLRILGHIVFESGDGQQALETLAKNKQIQLVITDNLMPEVSGIELLKRIKAINENIDVIIVTAYGNLETSIAALRGGAYDYILKPINIEELVVVIDRVAERQQLIKENQTLITSFDQAVQKAVGDTHQQINLLKEQILRLEGIGKIGLFSDIMQDVFQQAEMLHNNPGVSVIIQGETGTGKELIAKYIHYGPAGTGSGEFVAVNCAAIPLSLFESEMFGYDRGAFSGALSGGKVGKIELAGAGTLFLDEITEMPTEQQAKLLRVIQEHDYYRVGGTKKQRLDCRIICATNNNIHEKISNGQFRFDLYQRLNAFSLTVPPLRERGEAIISLAEFFLDEFNYKRKKCFQGFNVKAIDFLLAYPWPGNVRELKNVIDRVTLLYEDSEVRLEHLDFLRQPGTKAAISTGPNITDMVLPEGSFPLGKFINELIIKAYKMNNRNTSKTARYLSISRRSLEYKLKQLQGSPD